MVAVCFESSPFYLLNWKKKEFYQKLEQQYGKLLYLLLYYKQALSCQL